MCVNNIGLAYGVILLVLLFLLSVAALRAVYVMYKLRSEGGGVFTISQLWWGLFPLFSVVMLFVPGYYFFFEMYQSINSLSQWNNELLSNEVKLRGSEAWLKEQESLVREAGEQAHYRILRVEDLEHKFYNRNVNLDNEVLEVENRIRAANIQENENNNDNKLINEIHFALFKREQNIRHLEEQLHWENRWGVWAWVWHELTAWVGASNDQPNSLKVVIRWPKRDPKDIPTKLLPEEAMSEEDLNKESANNDNNN